MAISEIQKTSTVKTESQYVSSNAVQSIPNPQPSESTRPSFQAYPAVNFALGENRGDPYFITGLDGTKLKTVPFTKTTSPELQAATKNQPFFIPPSLAEVRQASLTEGFFVTEAPLGGFLLCMPKGGRPFDAYTIEDVNGIPITFYKNHGGVSVHNVEELYQHTLRNPEHLIRVNA